jgi:hypothetical protein
MKVGKSHKLYLVLGWHDVVDPLLYSNYFHTSKSLPNPQQKSRLLDCHAPRSRFEGMQLGP